jgi:hypothetical protein
MCCDALIRFHYTASCAKVNWPPAWSSGIRQDWVGTTWMGVVAARRLLAVVVVTQIHLAPNGHVVPAREAEGPPSEDSQGCFLSSNRQLVRLRIP